MFNWLSGPTRPKWLVRFDNWSHRKTIEAARNFQHNKSIGGALVLIFTLNIMLLRAKSVTLKVNSQAKNNDQT